MPRTSLAPRPLLPPSLSPSALSPSRDRTEPVAADQRSRGRSHPEASPTRPRAPPVLPRPPRRLTRPEEPQHAVPAPFFLLQPWRSPAIFHRHRAFPERRHRRQPALARPQPSPSLSDTPPRSDVPPSSSSSSQATRRAPICRPCPLLPPSAKEIAGDFSPSSSRPRAC